MSPKIITVRPLDNFRLAITWEQGSETEHDLAEIVAKKNWAAPLRDDRLFKTVTLDASGRFMFWPKTDVEMSADGFWTDLHPPKIQPAKWMSADDFRIWLHATSQTWQQAADALGISRRIVGYYLDGTQEIPKSIWLACMHIVSNDEKQRPKVILMSSSSANTAARMGGYERGERRSIRSVRKRESSRTFTIPLSFNTRALTKPTITQRVGLTTAVAERGDVTSMKEPRRSHGN